jgi:hypothetical protein
MARHPAAVFFLMPFRIAEFALGAWLAMTGSRAAPGRASHAASLAGLALILGSALLYDKDTRFPGLTAMVPALGAALLIWARSDAWGNRLLGLGPVRYIGRISYSLYLVHWPVVSLFAFRHGTPDSWVDVAVLTAASLGLGALLHHLVETPFRRTGAKGAFLVPGRALAVTMATGAMMLTAAGADIARRDGYDWRTDASLPVLDEAIRAGQRGRREAIRQDRCHFSRRNSDYFGNFEGCQPDPIDGAVVVFGDSHAADIWAALSAAAPDRPVVQLTAAGCDLARAVDPAERCDVFLEHARRWLTANRDRIGTVVYSQRAANIMVDAPDGTPAAPDPVSVERMATGVAELAAAGVPVVVWGPRPEFHPVIEVILGRSTGLNDFRRRMQAVDTAPYAALDAALRTAVGARGIPYLSSRDVLCATGICRFLDDDGGPLFVDYGHWSPAGGRFVLAQMADAYPAVRDLLGAGLTSR